MTVDKMKVTNITNVKLDMQEFQYLNFVPRVKSSRDIQEEEVCMKQRRSMKVIERLSLSTHELSNLVLNTTIHGESQQMAGRRTLGTSATDIKHLLDEDIYVKRHDIKLDGLKFKS